jgi:hypothetical protein
MSGFSFKPYPDKVEKLLNSTTMAIRATADKLLAEKIDDQQIPMAEGTLQNVYTDVDEKAVSKGEISIVSSGPYAAFLYYNPQFNFNQEFNTNAKGEWWEDILTGKKQNRPQEIFAYFMKKYSGGTIS